MNLKLGYIPFFITFLFLVNIEAQDDFSDESVSSEEILTISGVVINADTKKPVAGANIVVDGGDLGAAADEDGKYSIEGVSNVG